MLWWRRGCIRLNVSPGFNKLWHLSADKYPEARSSSADWHLGVGWSCDEEGGWQSWVAVKLHRATCQSWID